jgi:hypothetical protein
MRLLGEKLRSEDKEYGLISVGGEEMGEGVQKNEKERKGKERKGKERKGSVNKSALTQKKAERNLWKKDQKRKERKSGKVGEKIS